LPAPTTPSRSFGAPSEPGACAGAPAVRRDGGGRPHRRGRRHGPARRVGARVLEEESDALELSGTKARVDVGRLLDREGLRREEVEGQGAAGGEVEEARQVPALGPAHVPRRVVDAFQLVAVVVAAGAVGAREADVQLLLVVGVPRQRHLDLADVHHAAPVTRQPGGDLDGSARRPAGRHEDVVRPEAAAQVGERVLHAGQPLGIGCPAYTRAGLLGELAAPGDDVDADGVHPGGDEELHDELTDQAETDDARGVPELRRSPPHPVQRDRAHRGERREARLDALGHRDAEVDRDPIDLGVERELVARARHEPAGRELLGAASGLHHVAADRVAERRVGVEPLHRLRIGAAHPLLGGAVEDLAHLVRTGACLGGE
jgi:hypothetical protein